MQVMQNCMRETMNIESNLVWRKGNLQATLPSSCRAKSWMWCRGNGAKSFSLRKSYTHIPSNSVTRQMWFRWSNECKRCIHLLYQRSMRYGAIKQNARHLLSIHGITFFELLEDSNLDLTCVSILLDGADDLDRDSLTVGDIDTLHHLAKCALTQ